jgi:biotin carboxyl carrier protein
MPAAGGLAAGDQSVVRALMPGRILRVNVEQGAQVQRGQPLLVMESMKMEQTIAAPREGRVKSVMVDPGDSVTRGQTLIELE